jgi:hypothetical protein
VPRGKYGVLWNVDDGACVTPPTSAIKFSLAKCV